MNLTDLLTAAGGGDSVGKLAGKLAFGTIDCFLLWRLTGGTVHATDASNASRTLIYNIHTQDWDDDLLALFSIPRELLPDVRDCAADYGIAGDACLGGGDAFDAGVACPVVLEATHRGALEHCTLEALLEHAIATEV